jgi:glucosamine--fructose-6-phosphate aminotransferase (isomerizing)
MCGIVGYVGSGDALQVLLEGMRKLEYRGYDSAGIAIVSDEGPRAMTVVRKAGQMSELERELDGSAPEGSLGIGHTRWATHGAPTDRNAHPHRDCTGDIAVVHNGIIENHDVIRTKLEGEGHTFASDTDTEVAAHLIESIIAAKSIPLLDAVIEAVNVLEGAFALVCINAREPDRIIVARQEPPIIVGATADAGLVGSDIPALLAYTRDVIPLENHQVAEVKAGSVRVFDFNGNEVEANTVHVEWDLDAAEKGGYEDFMLKEIFEQPEAVRNTMRGRITEGGVIQLDEVHWDVAALTRITKIVIVACGTSFHAGMAARHAIEHWTRIPV